MVARTQYKRKASLLVGNETLATDLSQMHFRFSVRHGDKESPQSATVRVYNLNPKTILQIQAKEFSRLILQAGYQGGAYGVIFDGDIVQARIGRENTVDTYAEFLAAEGYFAHAQTVNKTLAAGAEMKDVADAAAQAMGLPLEGYRFDENFKLPRGRVLYGMARDALHAAMARSGNTYFYERGQIVAVPLQGFRPRDVVKVSADTGMIGWPIQTEAGIEVQVLLNPLLEIGGRIELNSASIQLAEFRTTYQSASTNGLNPGLDPNGVYRILTIDHLGNTRGQEWYTSLIAIAIDDSAGGISSLIQAGIG